MFGGARAQLAQLPDNQWQIEVSNWFSVGLATFQAFLVEKATGPKNVVENGGVITFPVNEWEKAVCEMQMVRNVAGYQNFSVVGVSVILVVGSLIVVCGWVVDWVTGLVQKRWKRGKYQRLSWVSDGYLQLQRLGWEGVGLEEWRGCDDVVPVARDLEAVVTVVPGLDIEDGEHPCFSKPTVVTDVSVGINK